MNYAEGNTLPNQYDRERNYINLEQRILSGWLTSLFFILLFLGFTLSSAFASGLSPQDSSPTSKEQKIWAVVVGINSYADQNGSLFRPLGHAREDAEAVAAMLVQAYNVSPARIALLTDGNATLVNMTRALQFKKLPKSAFATISLRVKNKTTAAKTSNVLYGSAWTSPVLHGPGPEDGFIFYFAGHGAFEEGSTPGYLVPVGFKHTSLSAELRRRVLDYDTLATAIAAIPTRNTLLLFDCCFSGSVFRTRILDKDDRNQRNGASEPQRSIQAFAAGTTYQTVDDEYKDPNWNRLPQLRPQQLHSPFTTFLLETLERGGNDDNQLPVSMLMSRVTQKVRAVRKYQNPQGAYLRGIGTGEELVLKRAGGRQIPGIFQDSLKYEATDQQRVQAANLIYRWVEEQPVQDRLSLAAKAAKLIGTQLRIEEALEAPDTSLASLRTALRGMEPQESLVRVLRSNINSGSATYQLTEGLCRWNNPEAVHQLKISCANVHLAHLIAYFATDYIAARQAARAALLDLTIPLSWAQQVALEVAASEDRCLNFQSAPWHRWKYARLSPYGTGIEFTRLPVYSDQALEARLTQRTLQQPLDALATLQGTDREGPFTIEINPASWLVWHGDRRGLDIALATLKWNYRDSNALDTLYRALFVPSLHQEAKSYCIQLLEDPHEGLDAAYYLALTGNPAAYVRALAASIVHSDDIQFPKLPSDWHRLPLSQQLQFTGQLVKEFMKEDAVTNPSVLVYLCHVLGQTDSPLAADLLYDAAKLYPTRSWSSISEVEPEHIRNIAVLALAERKDPRALPFLDNLIKNALSDIEKGGDRQSAITTATRYLEAVFSFEHVKMKRDYTETINRVIEYLKSPFATRNTINIKHMCTISDIVSRHKQTGYLEDVMWFSRSLVDRDTEESWRDLRLEAKIRIARSIARFWHNSPEVRASIIDSPNDKVFNPQHGGYFSKAEGQGITIREVGKVNNSDINLLRLTADLVNGAVQSIESATFVSPPYFVHANSALPYSYQKSNLYQLPYSNTVNIEEWFNYDTPESQWDLPQLQRLFNRLETDIVIKDRIWVLNGEQNREENTLWTTVERGSSGLPFLTPDQIAPWSTQDKIVRYVTRGHGAPLNQDVVSGLTTKQGSWPKLPDKPAPQYPDYTRSRPTTAAMEDWQKNYLNDSRLLGLASLMAAQKCSTNMPVQELAGYVYASLTSDRERQIIILLAAGRAYNWRKVAAACDFMAFFQSNFDGAYNSEVYILHRIMTAALKSHTSGQTMDTSVAWLVTHPQPKYVNHAIALCALVGMPTTSMSDDATMRDTYRLMLRRKGYDKALYTNMADLLQWHHDFESALLLLSTVERHHPSPALSARIQRLKALAALP